MPAFPSVALQATPGTLRALFQQAWQRVDLQVLSLKEGARAALSVAVIIAANVYFDWPPLFIAALAALNTCMCDLSAAALRRCLPSLWRAGWSWRVPDWHAAAASPWRCRSAHSASFAPRSLGSTARPHNCWVPFSASCWYSRSIGRFPIHCRSTAGRHRGGGVHRRRHLGDCPHPGHLTHPGSAGTARRSLGLPVIGGHGGRAPLIAG
jgi:hypothetical protein